MWNHSCAALFRAFYCGVLSRLELNGSTGKANAATNTHSAKPHAALHGGTDPEGESWLGRWVVLSSWKSRSLPKDVESSIFINSKQAEREQLRNFCSWDISHEKLVFLLQTVIIATKLGQGNPLGVSLRTDLRTTGIWAPGSLVFFQSICSHCSTRITS